MATITSRNGKWCVQVRKQGQHTSKTFTLKVDAEKWARETEVSIERGLFFSSPQTPNLTLKTVLELWEEEVLKRLKSHKVFKFVVKKLIKDLGNTPVAKITPKFLSDYRNKRLDIDGKAPQTVKHELGVIIRSLRLAREYGYEVGLVQMPKIKVKNQEVKVFTKGQLESIFDVLYQNDLYLFHVYRFLLETCMRRGELYRISLNNISFLTDTRYRGEGEGSTLLLKDTKNSEDRRIPLTSYARESLNYLLEHQTEKDLPFHIANNLKINYSPRYITEYFVHICRYGVGLEGVKLHWLRHQGITLLFEKGFNIMEVSSISGHKDLTSLKRYTHIDVEVLIPRLGESILKSC